MSCVKWDEDALKSEILDDVFGELGNNLSFNDRQQMSSFFRASALSGIRAEPQTAEQRQATRHAYAVRRWQRLKADPVRHAAYNAYRCSWYRSLSPEHYARLRARDNLDHRLRWKKMSADPAWMEARRLAQRRCRLKRKQKIASGLSSRKERRRD